MNNSKNRAKAFMGGTDRPVCGFRSFAQSERDLCNVSPSLYDVAARTHHLSLALNSSSLSLLRRRTAYGYAFLSSAAVHCVLRALVAARTAVTCAAVTALALFPHCERMYVTTFATS